MNMKKMLMYNECRQKLIEGVNLAADVVQVTYGPNGRTVICGDHITKDGMTAVSWVKDDDPYVMMGVNLMKDIAKRTADLAGDGTSTSVLLARQVINTCSATDVPLLKEGVVQVVESLKRQRKMVVTPTQLRTVATVSANGDTKIGSLVAEAFEKAGADGVVTYTESEDVEDSVSFCDGFRIDNGFAHPGFANTSQDNCELDNVFVYISDTKLSEAKEIIDIADTCMKKGKSLLLVAPDFDSEIYVFLQSNLDILRSCCVISPSFKKERAILVQDMRILLGEKSLCDKVIVSSDSTIFLCNRDTEKVRDRIEEIRNTLQYPMNDYEMEFHKKRLANFTSGIATISVGGYSQFEIKEKLDRVDDSIRATECAVREGLLVGGGIALYEASNELDRKYEALKGVLRLPTALLKGTGGKIDGTVIEPYLVVKTALENAINIAVTILTCDCAILPYSRFND